jgi:hypothetical protein
MSSGSSSNRIHVDQCHRSWRVETYSTFSAIADGVVDARVWGGIHWRTSSVRGRLVGEEIGRLRHAQFLETEARALNSAGC